MTKVESQQIDVYWLDDNQGEIFKALIYIGDQYICEALPKPRPNRASLERTPEDEKMMQLMSEYRITIDSFQRSQKQNLEGVAIINEKPKTLNNKFQVPGRQPKAKRPQPQETEFFEDDFNDDLTYEPQENAGGSWRNTFN